jgi:DNA replicative helicase MCM subunit Mcm2 (Cdc46/Mcm family)
LDDTKEMLLRALESSERAHTLLTGRPASAKSLFMLQIEKLLGHRVYFAEGAATTKAGLQKFIVENPHNALAHLNLVKQQLGSTSVITTPSNGTKVTSIPQVTKIKANHPPEAFNQTIVVDKPESRSIDLKGNDIDGDPITFSTTSNPTHGRLVLSRILVK